MLPAVTVRLGLQLGPVSNFIGANFAEAFQVHALFLGTERVFIS
jgi:hypothetical protein